MHDRAMQALYLLALDPIAECLAGRGSYGFRQARSCADAIEQCFNALARRNCAQWILEGDIQSCFERISQEWLLTHIPMDKVILHKWLTAGYMDKSVLHPTEEGTPQGGIISPVLANMALDGLERLLHQRYPHTGQKALKGLNKQVNIVRYADDFIITGSPKSSWKKKSNRSLQTFSAYEAWHSRKRRPPLRTLQTDLPSSDRRSANTMGNY
jgi:RNA-directed DNA polymerase